MVLVSARTYAQFQSVVKALLEEGKISNASEAVFINMHPPSRKQLIGKYQVPNESHLVGIFSEEERYLLTMPVDPDEVIDRATQFIAYSRIKRNAAMNGDVLDRLLEFENFMLRHIINFVRKYKKDVDIETLIDAQIVFIQKTRELEEE